MDIAKNVKEILEHIPDTVKLVAVSKTKPNNLIMEVYNSGYKVFGENRVQEMVQKYEDLPKDIEWHMIGHLQSNKVKFIAPFVTLIHSVDKAKLLAEINKEAAKNNRVIDCLLQFHIAEEETKFGLDLEEAKRLLESEAFRNMKHVRIVGIMGMATFTDDEKQVRREFKTLKTYFDLLKENQFKNKREFKEISMGMSGDYQIAIEEGATLIRLGSSVFGSR